MNLILVQLFRSFIEVFTEKPHDPNKPQIKIEGDNRTINILREIVSAPPLKLNKKFAIVILYFGLICFLFFTIKDYISNDSISWVYNVEMSFFCIIFITPPLLWRIYKDYKRDKIIKKYSLEKYIQILEQIALLREIRILFGLQSSGFQRGEPSSLLPEYKASHSFIKILPSHKFTGTLDEYWDTEKSKQKFKIDFVNGTESGLCKAWYKNGKVGYEQEYVASEMTQIGALHGIAKCWNEKGELIVDLRYNKGHVVFD
jgi:hypothetical protein